MIHPALSVLNKHVSNGTLVQGTMMLIERSLVPFGAGPLVGLTA